MRELLKDAAFPRGGDAVAQIKAGRAPEERSRH